MERDQSIDFFRCAANYLIVAFHAAMASCQYCDPTAIEYGVWMFLGGNCVVGLYALFLISGYLLFRNYALAAWTRKLVRRIRRLVVPYLCWNVVFVAFYLSLARIFPRLQARVTEFGLDTWQGAFGKIVSFFERPIDFPVWFMRTVFVYALISPILWAFLRHRVGRWIGLAAVAGLYVATDILKVIPDIEAYRSYSLLLFYAGGLLAVSGRTILSFFASKWWLPVGLLGFISGLEFNGGMMLKMTFFFAALGWLQGRFRFEGVWYRRAVKASFFVYAGHFLFCSMWVHTVGLRLASLGTGKFTLLMFVFLVPGLATVFAAYSLGKRCLPRALQLFDGTFGVEK